MQMQQQDIFKRQMFLQCAISNKTSLALGESKTRNPRQDDRRARARTFTHTPRRAHITHQHSIVTSHFRQMMGPQEVERNWSS
eukprot:scaffold232314_cov32-Tisochrysis_lutea.AAC.1